MVSMPVRGGRSVKIRLVKIMKAKTARYPCPRCGKLSVKRKGTAKWVCRSCGVVFVGGAYTPTTPGGEVAVRVVLDKGRK